MCPSAWTRPLVALLTTTTVVLTTAAAQSSGPSASPDAMRPAAAHPDPPTNVRMVTYNIRSKLHDRPVVADLRRLARSGADVLALQEMGSAKRRQAVREALVDCGSCGWGAFMPQEAPRGATPILYRTDVLRLVDAHSRLATEAAMVGAAGAGPRRMTAKYVNWVHLRVKGTGRDVYVVNNHTVPTVQARDGKPNKKFPRRVALYREHMQVLGKVVERLSRDGAVFVTGDFNVNYRRDRVVHARIFPYHVLGSRGLRASYASLGMPRRGTHSRANGGDTRLIDYVYFTPRGWLTPQRQAVLRGFSSDHRPLSVTFQVRPTR
jgi:endonuclease/exonuclease/phosphatase (EEP) superfamily protein YafD